MTGIDGEPGAAPRRERCDALENRQRLLAAAKSLFASQGVDQTDMYEVARAAGVGQGTLYRHFANKGELCTALIRDDLDAFMARVDAATCQAEKGASPLACLEQLIADQIRLTEEHLRVLAAIEAATGTPGPRPRSPWRLWLRGHVTRLLCDAASRGEIAEDVDTQYAADALLAVLSPRFLGYQREELGRSLEQVIASTKRVFVDGLRADRARFG